MRSLLSAITLCSAGARALASAAFLLALLLVYTGDALAQGQFVYINNNQLPNNTVSAFSVAANGALTPIAGSPFPTGGVGGFGGDAGAQRTDICPVGNFLYVTNSSSNNISAFSINPMTGVLTPVAGSPFAVPGMGDISIACTPNGQFLLAARDASSIIAVFSRAANGALTPVVGSPFPAGGLGPIGIKVTANGQFAIVSFLADSVGVLSISPAGALSPVGAFPLPNPAMGNPSGVAINCDSNVAYIGSTLAVGTRVDALSISPAGALASITGSPFTDALANTSSSVLLSPGGLFLFVSNLGSNRISVFDVAADGSISQVGSPFSGGGLSQPQQMVTNPAGTHLFVNNNNGTVSVFSIAANGALSAVAGSPFASGSNTRPGIAFYPMASCSTDLSVTKTVWSTGVVGSTAAYEITVTNQGSVLATNLLVTDILPPGTSFVPGSCMTLVNGAPAGTCMVVGDNLTATFPSLAPGQSATVKYTVVITPLAVQLGTVTNAVSVSSDTPDSNPNNNTTSVPLQVFDVCLQDDSNPAVVFLGNSVTGDYRFCCNGTVFSGRATAYKKGSSVTFEHNPADRRVLARYEGSVFKGTAAVQSPPGSIRCTITDRDTRNNTCQCVPLTDSALPR